MKDKYDVIVIGAGNGGLMAALNIASKGKSVLVLESNYISGGLATSFVKVDLNLKIHLDVLILLEVKLIKVDLESYLMNLI